uniref:Uncharacterized protein n=1 Tax=Rhizophora mucronata TaxID=61149 RepID=A0A2P2P9Z6_RHIMU
MKKAVGWHNLKLIRGHETKDLDEMPKSTSAEYL